VLSFAGNTKYEEPYLHWIHTMDSRGDAPPDRNPVSWQDDLLIESGSFELDGRPVTFVEEWGHLGAGGVTGLGRDGYVRVEAAGFAIEVTSSAGEFSSVKYQQRDGEWVEAARVDTHV
jgi:hypothetical protein